jgi:SagB-type dehydrogenase family enzyme
VSEDERPLLKGRRFLKANWHLMEGAETDQSRGVPAPAQQKPVPDGARLVQLVAPASLTSGSMPLMEAIRKRESRRKYTGASLSLEEASFLLYATQGIRKQRTNYSFRTVPSGGARHAFETYLYAARVQGVEPGLYRYLPLENRLCGDAGRPGMEAELDAALLGQYWNSAAVFVWTAVPYRMEWRYSLVAHKIIALDAGHVCQNLYLACESIGCGACAIGAYHQERMDSFLGVDGEEEFAVYAATVGKITG